jgi:hypothetical protein
MRTLHQGELYSIDKRAPLAGQLEWAHKRFRLKHKSEPVDVRWNPGAYKDDTLADKPAVDKSVPPGHVWLELASGPGE